MTYKSKNQTEYLLARNHQVSAAVTTVAAAEGRTVDFIRDEVAAGRVVIPANRHHRNLQPIGIGSALKVKINANIGNSSLCSDSSCEFRKLDAAVNAGADTVMDLSTGADIDRIRTGIIERARVPVGTVPIYEAVCLVENPVDLTAEQLLAVIERQARQGVDYMTVHAGLLREHLPLAYGRLLGIVSRGGALLGQWMTKHQRQNPFYEYFDDIMEICLAHDVTLSLGDGLRPGCLADASDEAQFAELQVLGQLVERCHARGVQVMVEGPGHIPLHQIRMNMEKEAEICAGAPFYILGPVVTDCAPGYDHITAAIGAALGALHGAAMLCYVTPKEHLGLPNAKDVHEGVMAFKIAAHAADIAHGIPNARDRDDAISRARAKFDWEQQFDLALDPKRARELRQDAIAEQTQQQQQTNADDHDQNPYCTMCGPKFCSMRISAETAAGLQ